MVLQPDNINEANIIASDEFRRQFHAILRRRYATVTGDLDMVTGPIVHEKRRRMTFRSRKYDIRVPPSFARVQPETSVQGEGNPHSSPSILSLFLCETYRWPLFLYREEYKEVPRESIEAVDHDLAKIDVDYIRDTLEDGCMAPHLYSIAHNCTIKEPRGALFDNVRIIVEDISNVGPTHMLLVHGPHNPQVNPANKVTMSMYPVHNLVLAAHCANLPPFPPASDPPEQHSDTTREYILPVVSVFQPSPETFPILLEYLYLGFSDRVMGYLLGKEEEDFSEMHELDRQEQLAREFANEESPSNLMECLHRVLGLWQNVCSLGIYDAEIWFVLDATYHVVLMGMQMRFGTPEGLESVKRDAIAFHDEICSRWNMSESESDDDMTSE